MNTNDSAMTNMLCSSAEHDMYGSHTLMDVSVSNPKTSCEEPVPNATSTECRKWQERWHRAFSSITGKHKSSNSNVQFWFNNLYVPYK